MSGVTKRSALINYLPLIGGLAILVIILLLTPWGQVQALIQRVPYRIFLALGAFSLLYYGSKAVRFWYILRLLDIKVPFKKTLALYLSGQAASILPAGEFYRTVMLKKHFNVSMSKSAPSVTIQGLVEAIVLILFSLVGAFVIGQSRLPIIFVAVLTGLVIVSLQRGYLGQMHALINKIPFVSVNHEKFAGFVKSHQQLLAPRPLVNLIGFSVIPVFSGIGILYLASHAVGFDIEIVQSMIGYSLPVILSGLSFLPGGLGVSEGGSIGMIRLFGASSAAAITITLLVRMFTLVAGLIYGLVAQIILHLGKKTV